MKKLCALGLALSLPAIAGAAEPPRPTAWTRPVQPLEAVQKVDMPPVDEAALLAEDERRFARTREKALRYAAPLAVDLAPEGAGTWEGLEGGELLWRLRIHSAGARSINLGFAEYVMPPGGRLFIYSADGKHVHRPFTDADNESHGQLWTPPVPGDDMVVELTLPAARRPGLRLRLAAVNHDYRGLGRPDMLLLSGACNIDVVCPVGDAYNDQDRAVGAISTGGSLFCSGSLVNNTANDARPYFMTADHCGIDAGNAASLVVFWNFQNSTCRPVGSPESGGPGDGVLTQFNTGSFFRSANSASDFTLVELDDPPLPAANVFLAGWDRTPNPGQFLSPIGVHHPSGDEKRITFGEGMTESSGWSGGDDGSHIHVFWGIGLGVTEPGSSGSPLYTTAGRYIGQLHGGASFCGASDLSDIYGRFSVSWTGGGTDSTRLSNWLDPLATGDIVIDGRNACTAAAPTGVAAAASGANRITVSWTPAGGATGYNVYRALGACPQSSYALVGSNVPGPSFDDNTVSGGTTYAYVVRTISGGCESGEASACGSATATGNCTLAPTFAGLASVTSAGTPACALTLAWSAATANCSGSTVKYNVYRSTTPGFTPGPANLQQSCVAGTAYLDSDVASGTTYHYVVRAEDSTANGSGPCNTGNEDANLAYGSGAPFGPTSTTVVDDVESGGAYWSTAGGSGGNAWAIVTSDAHSPTHSWFVADPEAISDRRLATAAAGGIPAGFVMSFFHSFDTEFGSGSTGYDGHVLEYSLDGSTWTDILAGQGTVPPNPSRLLMNGYNRTISEDFGSPLANRPAWSGDSGGFQEVRVDLADFSDRSAFFRFRFASDESVDATGVWIDNVTLRVPGACGGGGGTVDLSIAKSDSPDPVVGLQTLTYTLAVGNAGPDLATSVSVSDTLPAGAVFQSASGIGWTCGEASGTVTCTRPSLAVGAAPPISIAVTTPGAGGSLSNTATVTSADTDPVPANNSDTEATTVTAAPVANLRAHKAGIAGEARWGQPYSYRVTISSEGPATATGATVTDVMPAGLGGVTWTCSGTGGASCPAGGSGDIDASVTVPLGGEAVFVIEGTVVPGTTTLVNTATVSAPPGVFDPDPTNNTATSTVPAGPIAFYAVTPCRVADTRTTHAPALAANTSRNFAADGVCGVPLDALAVAMTPTVVNPTEVGNLRIYPAGSPVPLASTINFAAGRTRANNAIIPLGLGGGITVQCDMQPGSAGQTHFLFDVTGYFR